ncbi:MAG TPA: hypothetical protein VEN81_09770 [Planctomycetota bacterium]|nr:hypothetical protein [Planctomycetota bacterium]
MRFYLGSPKLGQVRLMLAQGASPTPSASTDVSSLASQVTAAIQNLPPAAVGQYQTRLAQCQAMVGDGTNLVQIGLASQCLRQLLQDIQSATPVAPPTPAAETFPILPALVAVLGIGGLIWVVGMLDGKSKRKAA